MLEMVSSIAICGCMSVFNLFSDLDHHTMVFVAGGGLHLNVLVLEDLHDNPESGIATAAGDILSRYRGVTTITVYAVAPDEPTMAALQRLQVDYGTGRLIITLGCYHMALNGWETALRERGGFHMVTDERHQDFKTRTALLLKELARRDLMLFSVVPKQNCPLRSRRGAHW